MVTNSLMSPIVFKTASTLLETVFFYDCSPVIEQEHNHTKDLSVYYEVY